jgi:MFS family permease
MIAVSPIYAMVFAIMIGTAVCDSLGGVAGNSFIQRRTPDAVRSRVFAAVTSMWLMANVVAFPTAGLVLSVFGPRAVYVTGAVVAVVATIMILPLLRETASGPEPSRTP